MKEHILKIIHKLSNENKKIATNAVVELIELGIIAVPHIIDIIRNQSEAIFNSIVATKQLCNVLLKINHPDTIPIFIELLHDENSDLAITAFKKLGQSKDQRALQPLLDCLFSEETNFLAISALGELGFHEAIEPLLKLADTILQEPIFANILQGNKIDIDDEDFYDGSLTLLPRIIIALAKLGNNDLASFAIPLTNYYCDSYSSEDLDIRIMATKALQYVVVPNMLTTLQSILHNEDESDEVHHEAIEAMFYLGVKETIPEIIKCMEDVNSELYKHALWRLYELTGIWLNCLVEKKKLMPEQALEWWQNNEYQYQKNICYRLGKPLYLPNIIELLENPDWQGNIVKELEIITSINFNFYFFKDETNEISLVEKAQKWWQQESYKFEAGKLYKYGKKQDISIIF